MGPETDKTCVCLRRQGVQSSQDSHTEEKTHEDTERRRSSANQKERPQQKRTRTAPWWGLPTSRTVRKYFCCLCHLSVVLHYGSPSNKPHFTIRKVGARISSQTEPVLMHTRLRGLHSVDGLLTSPRSHQTALQNAFWKCLNAVPYSFSQLFSGTKFPRAALRFCKYLVWILKNR